MRAGGDRRRVQRASDYVGALSGPALRTELSKVMIHVEVRPAKPGRFRHPAEHGMHPPVDAFRLCRDAIEKHLELCDISREIERTRAADFLIDFGPRRDSSRPS